ncbi:hypothetical protein ILT44_20520 [Microvirga sp. BT689]|uniref:hypothetical protein n=1 Tax=Microvirga arvi TaxID=2778731 RepID=UPI00194E36B7|nr:hypothetical protein [Microvirga arvi]MBM6582594.1 hypothetical protein [Microvirga arvi]
MTFTKTTAVALSLGMICSGAAFAAPTDKHDGTWQVQMVTESGICGTNTYAITVEKGNVRYHGNPGETPAQISGQIATDGAVSLDIRRSSAKAEASGSLAGQAGSGVWKVDSYGCSGRWNAQKRSSVARS